MPVERLDMINKIAEKEITEITVFLPEVVANLDICCNWIVSIIYWQISQIETPQAC